MPKCKPRTSFLGVHFGPPVYNSLDCLRPIFHRLFTSNRTVANSGGGHFSPSLSFCWSSSNSRRRAINQLLIRLKRLSQKQEVALLCLERGQTKAPIGKYIFILLPWNRPCLVIIPLLPVLRFWEFGEKRHARAVDSPHLLESHRAS